MDKEQLLDALYKIRNQCEDSYQMIGGNCSKELDLIEDFIYSIEDYRDE